MAQSALLVATALSLGAVHSFAPDHLAAVSVFVSRRPSWRRAFGLGARWGLGHSATILLVGGALAFTGLHLPVRFAAVAEQLVGITLILLGMVSVARARKLHGHWHEHEESRHWHLHSHHEQEGHDHSHRTLVGIGMLHGLAGTGALVVALPAAVTGSAGRSLVFLISFGVGTTIAMALFGAVAGCLVGAAARASVLLHRGAVALAGVVSVAVGLWWVTVAGR
jgi:sulfite exporter TauE/SafE